MERVGRERDGLREKWGGGDKRERERETEGWGERWWRGMEKERKDGGGGRKRIGKVVGTSRDCR